MTRIPCNKCDAYFTYKSQLKIHSRIHSGEKPFRCDKCGKSFKRLQQCKVHISLGHEHKQIACPELNCGRNFGTKSNLIRHQLAFHLNFKRWICGFCSHSFAQSQDLRRHLLKCHQHKMKTILYKDKKAMEEVYIIPEPNSEMLSEDILKRIYKVYDEEKLKLSFKSNSKSINRPMLNLKKEKSKNKISNSLEISSQNVSLCLYCKSIIQLEKLETCKICSDKVCSSHIHCHTVEKHPIIYQCYFCKLYFNTENMCAEHIQKLHRSRNYGQNQVIFTEPTCNYSTPFVPNYSCFATPPVICIPIISDEKFKILQVSNNAVANISYPDKVVGIDPTVKHVFQTVPINSENSSAGLPPQNKSDNININCSARNVASTINVVATESSSVFKNEALNFNLNNSEIINNLQETNYNVEKIAKENDVNAPKIQDGVDERVFVISLRNRPIKVINVNCKNNSANCSLTSMKTQKKRVKKNISGTFYKCDVCLKEFLFHNLLRRHSKIHGIRKYACNICDKTFSEKYNLKTHMLKHSKENPRCCHLCEKKFRYSRDLKDHLLIHQGLTPYSCQDCDAQFLRKRDLLRHRKEQHLLIRYNCKICGLSFKRKDYLERTHMSSHRINQIDSMPI